MPRTYRVPYTGTLTTAGADADIIALTPADDKPIRLKGWILGQSSEFGDAQAESVRLTMRHMTATVTVTGGTSVTPVANRPGTTDVAAAGFTATANSTTVATTSGTSTIMEELGWTLQASPWERYIPDEDRPMATQGEYLLLRLESTLADDITVEVTFLVEELP